MGGAGLTAGPPPPVAHVTPRAGHAPAALSRSGWRRLVWTLWSAGGPAASSQSPRQDPVCDSDEAVTVAAASGSDQRI